MSRVLLKISLVAGVLASSGCAATAAICATWAAAPCIVCFGDGTQDPGGPYQATSVEMTSPAMSMATASDDDTSMSY